MKAATFRGLSHNVARHQRRVYQVGSLLIAALTGTHAGAANPVVSPGPATSAPVQRTLTAISTLQGTFGYTKLEVRVDQPLAQAKGSQVPLAISYSGPASVAFVQVPLAVSYAIGPFAGSFQHTTAVDLRAVLKNDEAQILTRCKASLDTKQADVVETTHDAAIPLIVTGADGAVAASTTVAYQVGLVCRTPPPPLVATIGYAKIDFNINQPLARAQGGLVPMTLKYEGVSTVQVPGSLSYPLAAPQGGFAHTMPSVDIRAMLKRDEAAILARCQATLAQYNVSVRDTVHDTRIPVTITGADGAVVASTTVPYQLGLTCRR